MEKQPPVKLVDPVNEAAANQYEMWQGSWQQARIQRMCRWFELSKQISDAGNEIGEKRFEKYLETLNLSQHDITEIIEQLEPVRRGPYTGSLGYMSWSGDLDLNIIIRTLVMTDSCSYLQVGAGIVADSDPLREYEETLLKAQAVMKALGVS